MDNLKQFLNNKKSMTLVAGILLLVSIAFLSVYFLTGVLATQAEQNADAGNVTVTLLTSSSIYEDSCAD